MATARRKPKSVPSRAAWEAAAREAIGDRARGGAMPLLSDRPEAPDPAFLSEVGFPGEAPYTRGIHPTMYRGRLWTSRQPSGSGGAEATNRRFRSLLKDGQSGFSVAFDLPTQIGFDSDHPRARGQVAHGGVPIATLGDMRSLLAGLPLREVTVSLSANATAPILLPLLVAAAEEGGVRRTELSGTVQNDVLPAYSTRGSPVYPPEASMRLAIDVIEFATREMPNWNPISVSGYALREAGATAAQEIAFPIAHAIAYARAAARRGLDVDALLSRISFHFSADRHFLEEIAKFRAARRLWARTVRNVLGAKSARSQQLRFHAQTARSSLTAQQPELNVVRTTLEALSAVLGGGQSLHTNALDAAIGDPTEGSARLALRTQQILAEESGVASTVDPLGGAYAIEEATDRLEREAEEYLARVEAMGGALAAVASGFFAGEIAREAERAAQARQAGTEIVVGVNALREGNPTFSLFPKDRRRTRNRRVSAPEEPRQIARVRAWKRRRDARAVADALAALDRASAGADNLIPFVLAAVRAGATLGEIAELWRRRFGESPPSAGL